MSQHLVGYLKLCADGRFDEIQQQILHLPKCVDWLSSDFVIVPKHVEDSDSDTSDSNDDDDDDMEVSGDEETEQAESKHRTNRPQTDEDGWTTVPVRRRN